MKLKGFALTLQMGLMLAMMTVILVGGMSVACVNWYRNYQSDMLRDKCNQLDYAVRRYGQTHEMVVTTSESYAADGTLHYNMAHIYPSSQTRLADLHTLGYLQPNLKISDFQWKSTSTGNVIQDTSVIFYKVNGNCTQYRIEVLLPNGKTYVTPGSSTL